jgi:hypothetical protein
MAGPMYFVPLRPAWRIIEARSWFFSIGDRLDPKQIGPVPSNAIIVNQAVDPGALLIPAISYSSNVGEPSIT